MRTFLKIIVLGPIAIAAILLAVANRGPVRLVLDPFAGEGALGFDVPLFAVILVSLAAGLVLGGLGTWLGQHRYRKAARTHRRDLERQRAEADRLRVALADATAANGAGASAAGTSAALPAPRRAA